MSKCYGQMDQESRREGSRGGAVEAGRKKRNQRRWEELQGVNRGALAAGEYAPKMKKSAATEPEEKWVKRSKKLSLGEEKVTRTRGQACRRPTEPGAGTATGGSSWTLNIGSRNAVRRSDTVARGGQAGKGEGGRVEEGRPGGHESKVFIEWDRKPGKEGGRQKNQKKNHSRPKLRMKREGEVK